MKLFCTIVMMAMFTAVVKAQDNVDVTNVTKLTLLSPGLSYEHRVGKLQTMKLAAMMAASFGYSYSSSMGSKGYLYLDPSAILAYRYYYNSRERSKKGKRTEMNSLNYISPVAQLIYTDAAIVSDSYTEADDRAVTILGLVWGMQRNYKSRFSLDLNLGLGYQFGQVTKFDQTGNLQSKTSGTVVPIGELALGIWLNKRK